MGDKHNKNNKPRARNDPDGNKKKFLESLKEAGGNVTKASELSGLDRTRHYEYMKDPEYAAQAMENYEILCDEAEQTIVNLMKNSPVDKVKLDSAKEILKARGKNRGYGVEKREQDHKGEVNLNHQAKVTVYLPDNDRS